MDTQSVKLIDQSGEVRPLDVTIKHVNGSIFLCPDGYGDACSEDGMGDPIMIEVYDGQVRVILWSDINKEDPTHIINMEKSREDNRDDD